VSVPRFRPSHDEASTRMSLRYIRPAAVASTALALLLQPATARAQDVTGRVAMEAGAAISFLAVGGGGPGVLFEQTSTIGVGHGWDVIVRPWARRMPGGDWGAEMYQLQMRFTSSTHIPFRFDAGVISSPLGLATLELKPDLNPTIGAPFYYFVP